jgi:hypothetical protein
MSVAGAEAKPMFNSPMGTINTENTFFTNTPQDPPWTFKTPVNILAIPVLQSIGETSDQSSAGVFVQEFVDGGVTKTGPFMGIAAKACTKIVWGMHTKNCFASAACLAFFF